MIGVYCRYFVDVNWGLVNREEYGNVVNTMGIEWDIYIYIYITNNVIGRCLKIWDIPVIAISIEWMMTNHNKPRDCMIVYGILCHHIFRQLPSQLPLLILCRKDMVIGDWMMNSDMFKFHGIFILFVRLFIDLPDTGDPLFRCLDTSKESVGQPQKIARPKTAGYKYWSTGS